ncbi:MAG TPA: hypothetical protein VGH79_01970 [Gaiellaceae bacterium]|jgi:hypothetical protein
MELWHFSEDPTIDVFVPHRAPTSELDDKLVWAVDSAHRWLYWFPRDCPRATWCAGDGTTDEDVERWLDGDRARRVAVVEERWLEQMRSVALYAYRLPPDTFEPWDKFFVSRETVVPSELVALGDLVEQHAEGGTDLRFAPALYPLWDDVIATTLDFSGIRLRNAERA